MGPDAEMSNMSWRCCCQLSEEASRIYAFFFLKLRRQFSEIAMENTRPTSTPWKSKEISLLGNDDVPGRQKIEKLCCIFYSLKQQKALSPQYLSIPSCHQESLLIQLSPFILFQLPSSAVEKRIFGYFAMRRGQEKCILLSEGLPTSHSHM